MKLFRRAKQWGVFIITLLWGLVCGLLTALIIMMAAMIPRRSSSGQPGNRFIESMQCFFGFMISGLLTGAVPFMDLAGPRIASKQTRPPRWVVAMESMRIYGLCTWSFAVATFYFPRRDRLNALIR